MTKIVDIPEIKIAGINNKFLFNPKANRLVLSQDYRKFKDDVMACTMAYEHAFISMRIELSCFCDIDAPIKAIIDAVCTKLDYDDKHIIRLEVEKKQIKRGSLGSIRVFVS